MILIEIQMICILVYLKNKFEIYGSEVCLNLKHSVLL